MEKIILIKYGELTTKKANRNLFISKIYEQMKELLVNYDVKIIKNRVRMFLEVDDNELEEVVNINGKDYMTGYTSTYVKVAIELNGGKVGNLDVNSANGSIVNVKIAGFIDDELMLVDIIQ